MNGLLRNVLVVSFAALVAAPAVRAAEGDTVHWVNATSKEGAWSTLSNWDPSTDIPTNRENVVLDSLGDGFSIGLQRLHTTATSGGKVGDHPNEVDPYIGSITGDVRHVVSIDNLILEADTYGRHVYLSPSRKGAYNTAADGTLSRFMDVLNPNGFYGLWRPMGMTSRLVLHSSDSFTPVLHDLSSLQRPVLSDLGTGLVEVEVVHGGGTFDKFGSGALALDMMGGESTRLYSSGGTLRLSGPTAAKIAAIEAKAALHLDASEAASLVMSGSSVTRWNDVRGADYPYVATPTDYTPVDANRITSVDHPTVGGTTEHPLVAFGVRGSNCAMAVQPASFPNVRAVVYVAAEPYGCSHVFGDLSAPSFHSGDHGNELYDTTYSDVAVREAAISFNLRDVTYNTIPNAERQPLHVIGQNILRDTPIGLLGTSQYLKNKTGGTAFGEVLIFTNEITQAERTLLARHLYEKWIEGRPLPDFRDVVSTDSNVLTFDVPAGETVRVGQILAPGGIVKSGAGTLVVGNILPTDAAVAVNGGSVSYKPPAITDTLAGVPSDPYFWIDAENVDAAGIFETNGVKYVKTWKDTRDGSSLVATTTYKDVPHMPRLVDSTVCGRKVVDFGKFNTNSSAWDTNADSAAMRLPNYSKSAGRVYNYYCVMRVKNEAIKTNGKTNGGMANVWCASMDGYHDGEYFASANYRSLLIGAAKWYIDGRSIDPFANQDLNFASATNAFVLVSASTTKPFHPDMLCAAYPYERNCGGFEIGEYIMYDRALTVEEHLSVEAYLMKKWLGKTHPVKDTAAHDLTFVADADIAVDTDSDMTIRTVTGGNGTVEKSGSGAITVGSFAEMPTQITVNEGSLSMPVGGLTLLDEARFHFDASRLETMTYAVDGQGNTNVSVWADVRGNGLEARASLDSLATVLPKRVTVSSGRGTQIPVMDFGEYSWRTNDYAQVGKSATMAFYLNGQPESHVIFEAFCVFADAPGSKTASVFGNRNGHEFQREWSTGNLISNYSKVDNVWCKGLQASGVVRNSGLSTLDGGTYWAAPEAGKFHIYDFVPSQSSDRTPGWATPAAPSAMAQVHGSVTANSGESWGYDYDLEWEDRGGILIAEQLAFDRILTAAESKYVTNLLKYKWYGAAYPGDLTNTVLEAVSVAAGSTLTLRVPDAVTFNGAKVLAGEGQITTPELAVSEALDVTIRNGKTSCLAVNGTVVFDGTLAVNVTVDAGAGKIRGGTYPILTASSFENFEATEVTVNVLTPDTGICETRVERQGNTLYLTVVKRGLLLMVR